MNDIRSFLFCFCLVLSQCVNANTGPQLIGLTSEGGSNWGGTIVRYTGGDTVISSYFSLPAGANPAGSLMQASDGKMYGLTSADGDSSHGTLFEYDYASSTYTVMVNFTTATGYRPFGTLTQAGNGLLYGFTTLGGTNSSGTLFSYLPGSNSVTVVQNLPTSSYGAPRGAPVQAANGKLYALSLSDGTNGGGTITECDLIAHTYTVKFSFPGSAYPTGSLLQAGPDSLYGLTYGDGPSSSGTLFRFIASTGACDTLCSFSHGEPNGSLIRGNDGKLYGALAHGGPTYQGSLFSYDIYNRVFTDLYDLNSNTNDGATPAGTLFQASNGLLYGMTSQGGWNGYGTVFSYNITSSAYTREVYLDSTVGTLALYGGFIEYNPTLSITPVKQAETNTKIYSQPGAIIIDNPDAAAATIMVTDILGRQVINTVTTSPLVTLPVQINDAVYIVQVMQNGHQTIRKVFVP